VLLALNQLMAFDLLQDGELECGLTILVESCLKVRILVLSTTQGTEMVLPSLCKADGTSDISAAIGLILDLIDAARLSLGHRPPPV